MLDGIVEEYAMLLDKRDVIAKPFNVDVADVNAI
jgi:hypothetical protein